MTFWRFVTPGVGILLLCIGVAEWMFYLFPDSTTRLTIYLGIAIAFGNAVIGFAFISWGFTRSHHRFLLSVYGSMIFRFLLIFSLLFILIGAFKMDAIQLVSALMITYFLFLGLEIFLVNRMTEVKRNE